MTPSTSSSQTYAFQTDVAATNATFTFNDGDGVNVTVVPSTDGRATDVEATTDSIMAALQARVNGRRAPSDVAARAGASRAHVHHAGRAGHLVAGHQDR